jgi:hypothetical protein
MCRRKSGELTSALWFVDDERLRFVSHARSAGDVKWHEIDGKVDRRSFMGKYALDPKTKLPLCEAISLSLSLFFR